jgi:hypothetical protein
MSSRPHFFCAALVVVETIRLALEQAKADPSHRKFAGSDDNFDGLLVWQPQESSPQRLKP